jgi:hypothetical protein
MLTTRTDVAQVCHEWELYLGTDLCQELNREHVVKEMFLTAAMLAFISAAQAQVVVQSPGHRPAYAMPRGDGTYVIPGQRPTYITPRGDGTYVVQSPGHRPAYAMPRGNGTYVIPGRRPTYLTPR